MLSSKVISLSLIKKIQAMTCMVDQLEIKPSERKRYNCSEEMKQITPCLLFSMYNSVSVIVIGKYEININKNQELIIT